jgi:coproporphyrinogen III oxidase
LSAVLETRQRTARTWFGALQQGVIEALEALEREAPSPLAKGNVSPRPFAKKSWDRTDHSGAPGGGGTMATLAGRLFEKAGVHVSTVFGTFAPEFASQIPGADVDPRFWASGISVIIHPRSPHVPTVHMNTRFVCTSKAWFGGGADLTPMLNARRRQDDPDAIAFHEAMRVACERHSGVADYRRFKEWCDEYFFLKHRNEPRGIGGIFFDYLNSTGHADNSNWSKPWSESEREEQLIQRGRYVEFNLLYDRGTIFGLKTGGNVDSILSSLPPMVRWP